MNKNTWIIISLVLILGLIYFFTKEDKISVGIKHLELPFFDQEKITRIEITGKNPIILIKQDSQWFLELPDSEKAEKYLVSAEQTKIKAMLDAAAQVQQSYYVTQLEDRFKDLGLSKDTSTLINLQEGDKIVWSLELGNSADSVGRYAKLPSDKNVFVVKAPFAQLLRANINDWRDRTILPLKEQDLVSFKLEKNGQAYLSLARTEGKFWDFAADQPALPKAFKADHAALASLVRSLVDLRAAGFNDKPLQLEAPVVSINIKDKSDKIYKLLVYPADQDKFWIKIDGAKQVYEITKFNVDKFNKTIEELRDYSLMNFDKAGITKIIINNKINNIILEKTADKWQIKEPKNLPDDFEFDERTAHDLLSVLRSLTANRLAVALKDLPRDSTWLKTPILELADNSAKTYKIFASPSKNNNEYLIKGNIDDQIYVINTKKLSLLLDGLKTFKKEEFDLPPIDENTKGFESLPVDIQRKLLDAAKKSETN